MTFGAIARATPVPKLAKSCSKSLLSPSISRPTRSFRSTTRLARTLNLAKAIDWIVSMLSWFWRFLHDILTVDHGPCLCSTNGTGSGIRKRSLTCCWRRNQAHGSKGRIVRSQVRSLESASFTLPTNSSTLSAAVVGFTAVSSGCLDLIVSIVGVCSLGGCSGSGSSSNLRGEG